MKNQLIRTVLSAVVISALFLSCGKEKEADYFIRFKVDGQTIEFKKAGFVVEQSADPDKIYIIIGARSTDLKSIFTVDVEVPKELAPGTYDSENDMLALGYGVNGSPSMYYTMWPVSTDPDPHYVLTVTSISETEIRGHFTGNFLADEDGNIAALTEGEFVAKLNQQ